jgi:hypothetical protein
MRVPDDFRDLAAATDRSVRSLPVRAFGFIAAIGLLVTFAGDCRAEPAGRVSLRFQWESTTAQTPGAALLATNGKFENLRSQGPRDDPADSLAIERGKLRLRRETARNKDGFLVDVVSTGNAVVRGEWHTTEAGADGEQVEIKLGDLADKPAKFRLQGGRVTLTVSRVAADADESRTGGDARDDPTIEPTAEPIAPRPHRVFDPGEVFRLELPVPDDLPDGTTVSLGWKWVDHATRKVAAYDYDTVIVGPERVPWRVDAPLPARDGVFDLRVEIARKGLRNSRPVVLEETCLVIDPLGCPLPASAVSPYADDAARRLLEDFDPATRERLSRTMKRWMGKVIRVSGSRDTHPLDRVVPLEAPGAGQPFEIELTSLSTHAPGAGGVPGAVAAATVHDLPPSIRLPPSGLSDRPLRVVLPGGTPVTRNAVPEALTILLWPETRETALEFEGHRVLPARIRTFDGAGLRFAPPVESRGRPWGLDVGNLDTWCPPLGDGGAVDWSSARTRLDRLLDAVVARGRDTLLISVPADEPPPEFAVETAEAIDVPGTRLFARPAADDRWEALLRLAARRHVRVVARPVWSATREEARYSTFLDRCRGRTAFAGLCVNAREPIASLESDKEATTRDLTETLRSLADAVSQCHSGAILYVEAPPSSKPPAVGGPRGGYDERKSAWLASGIDPAATADRADIVWLFDTEHPLANELRDVRGHDPRGARGEVPEAVIRGGLLWSSSRELAIGPGLAGDEDVDGFVLDDAESIRRRLVPALARDPLAVFEVIRPDAPFHARVVDQAAALVRGLPAEPLGNPFPEALPAVVRELRSDDRVWLAVANPTTLTFELDLVLHGVDPDGFESRSGTAPGTGGGAKVSRAREGLVVQLPVGPFTAWNASAKGREARLATARVRWPESELASLRKRMDEVRDGIVGLERSATRHKSEGVTADFETGAAKSDLPSMQWESGQGPSRVQVDPRVARSGKQSLLLTSAASQLVSRSMPFETSDELVLTLWLLAERTAQRVSITVESSDPDATWSEARDVEASPRWSRHVLRVSPPAHVRGGKLRLRVRPLEAGRVWIDDVVVQSSSRAEEDYRLLIKTEASLSVAWREGRYADCERLLAQVEPSLATARGAMSDSVPSTTSEASRKTATVAGPTPATTRPATTPASVPASVPAKPAASPPGSSPPAPSGWRRWWWK